VNTDSLILLARAFKEDIYNSTKPPEQVTNEFGLQVIPLNLFKHTRDFLLKVCIQINQTYEHACYDACAVMIRRMLEMLIIITFEYHEIEIEIKDGSGNYLMLSGLIPVYINHSKWSLSRNTKTNLPLIKDLGDFSAHRLHYNAQRGDIDKILDKYHLRTIVEEMLYKSGLKT
jgi:hypothetical protein